MTHPGETWHDAEPSGDAVARVLATLDPAEWTVYRNLRWPTREFASLEHVVVGPQGVFVIDSVAWSGRVSVAMDRLRHHGQVRDSEVVGAGQAAAALAGFLGPGHEVTPVLCFVRDEWLTGTARDVLVCSTANLAAMLDGRSTRIRPDRLRVATRVLNRWEIESPRGTRSWAPALLDGDPGRRRFLTDRRVLAVLALVLVAAVVLAVLMAGG